MCVFSFPRELAELQKANAVTQSAAQEAALSAEQSAREELKGVLDQQKLGAQREKEALLMQVSMSVSVFPYNWVIVSEYCISPIVIPLQEKCKYRFIPYLQYLKELP